MKYKTGATVHVCDGCRTPVIQLDLEPIPNGHYLDVMTVNKDTVHHGHIFTCTPKCILPAYKNLEKTWSQPRD